MNRTALAAVLAVLVLTVTAAASALPNPIREYKAQNRNAVIALHK